MEHVELIDYAHPMMMAEQKMKAAHSAALEHAYDAAEELITQAIVELRITTLAFRHMQENQR